VATPHQEGLKPRAIQKFDTFLQLSLSSVITLSCVLFLVLALALVLALVFTGGRHSITFIKKQNYTAVSIIL